MSAMVIVRLIPELVVVGLALVGAFAVIAVLAPFLGSACARAEEPLERWIND